jgi:hypothetical protein
MPKKTKVTKKTSSKKNKLIKISKKKEASDSDAVTEEELHVTELTNIESDEEKSLHGEKSWARVTENIEVKNELQLDNNSVSDNISEDDNVSMKSEYTSFGNLDESFFNDKKAIANYKKKVNELNERELLEVLWKRSKDSLNIALRKNIVKLYKMLNGEVLNKKERYNTRRKPYKERKQEHSRWGRKRHEVNNDSESSRWRK